MSFTTSRRALLLTGAATGATLAMPWVARAAPEFSLKYANNSPVTHPLTIRAVEAMERIKKETNGRVEIQIFPNNQLGSDTDMLSQLRSGAHRVLHPVGPDPGDAGAGGLDQRHRLRVGRATTRSGPPWTATSAPTSARQIAKAGLSRWTRCGTTASARSPRRPSPIKTAEDLKGFKIRVPPSPLWTSMFKAFDAAPTSINFSEIYSALQTKVVEGQENPLAIIFAAKLYEVQKYLLADQPHVGRFLVPRQRQGLGALPADVRDGRSRRTSNAAAVEQRADIAKLNDTCRRSLTAKGMSSSTVDHGAVPRQAAGRRLLQGMARQVRRRGVGDAGEITPRGRAGIEASADPRRISDHASHRAKRRRGFGRRRNAVARLARGGLDARRWAAMVEVAARDAGCSSRSSSCSPA